MYCVAFLLRLSSDHSTPDRWYLPCLLSGISPSSTKCFLHSRTVLSDLPTIIPASSAALVSPRSKCFESWKHKNKPKDTLSSLSRCEIQSSQKLSCRCSTSDLRLLSKSNEGSTASSSVSNASSDIVTNWARSTSLVSASSRPLISSLSALALGPSSVARLLFDSLALSRADCSCLCLFVFGGIVLSRLKLTKQLFFDNLSIAASTRQKGRDVTGREIYEFNDVIGGHRMQKSSGNTQNCISITAGIFICYSTCRAWAGACNKKRMTSKS